MDETAKEAIEYAQSFLNRPLRDLERDMLLAFLRDNPGTTALDVINRLVANPSDPFSNHAKTLDERTERGLADQVRKLR
ncbi:hypothetical protein ACPA5B_11800 [Pseudomonas solani]|uniref:hypothetical protein n=1 Tax=Pseudomonas solani TaxID=2731552 RepID=UPI003C2F7AD7